MLDLLLEPGKLEAKPCNTKMIPGIKDGDSFEDHER